MPKGQHCLYLYLYLWANLLGIPRCCWERNPELKASGHSCVQEGRTEAWVLNSGCSRPPLESCGIKGPICCVSICPRSADCWVA